MSSKDRDDSHFLANVRASLERGASGLDRQSCMRLGKIRHAALDTDRVKPGLLFAHRSFGAFASACILVLAVGLLGRDLMVDRTSVEVVPSGAAFEDIEILTSSESFEFYEEFEFYLWLAENDTSA